MKRPAPIFPILKRAFLIRFIVVAGLAAALMQACTSSDDEDNGLVHFPETVTIENPPADSVVFWPPGLRYVRAGDTLFAEIRGLKRTAECAVLLFVSWNFFSDTTRNQYYQARSRFRIPGGSSCRLDSVGIDTTFKISPSTVAGKSFYLEYPKGVVMDSVLYVSGLSQAAIVTFLRPRGSPDSVVNGRFVFRDSTAARPRRSIHSGSLATCEIMQAAVYDWREDTLVVRMRRIEAVTLPATLLPACAGPHADSIGVSFNRYNIFQ